MVEELHRIRRQILKRLAYDYPQTFADLHDDRVPSNKFSYHLQQLVEDGYIDKHDDGYRPTKQGEEVIARLAEEGFGAKEQPILGVIILVCDNDRLLVSTRKKEPFKGYTGTGPHGRVSKGEHPHAAARRILRERTGLEADDITLEGLLSVNTMREDELLYAHYHFIASCSAVSGELQEENSEFTNTWVHRDDLDEYTLFTEHPHVLDIERQEGFTVLEAERIQSGKELTDVHISQTSRY